MSGTRMNLWWGLMLWLMVLTAQAETLTMGVGDWCPYVCDPHAEAGREGYLVELMREVFEPQGIAIETMKLPFARNVQMNRQGLLDGIIGVYRTDRRELSQDFVFSRHPLGWGVSRWYVAASSDWRYRGLDSLDELTRIATVKGYAYGLPALDTYLGSDAIQAISITGHDPQKRLIHLLLRGRIDAFVEDNNVAEYELASAQTAGIVRSAGALGQPMPVYIAFSPALDESRTNRYRTLLCEGVNRLRQSGRLEALLERYRLDDWSGRFQSIPAMQ